jgi:hypothetical protein
MNYVEIYVRESQFPIDLYGDPSVFRRIVGRNVEGEYLYIVSIREDRRDLLAKLRASS